MLWEELFSRGFYRELFRSDFNLGYATGAGLVLGLLILLVILRIIVRLVFRRRRSSAIVVPDAAGELIISSDAVEKAARSVLGNFKELNVHKIRLYRQGKKSYQLLLFCTFVGGGRGLPELSSAIRPQLLETLGRLFGVHSLRKVQFRIDSLEEGLEHGIASPAIPDEEEAVAVSGEC